MLTVALLPRLLPSRPVQDSVYVVCPLMGLDVCVPFVPVQESLMFGLFSVTEHEAVCDVLHSTMVVSPERKSDGRTRMNPLGDGGPRHTPLAHP
jgi:hypothetical protein